MGNTAKKFEIEENSDFERWLKEEAGPHFQDVMDGKVECMPLLEAYDLSMQELAEARRQK